MHTAVRTPRIQAGFTLVELVTVILILGVLAAVALPRYADLQGKARESKVKAVAGSMKSAMGLVKASAMANGISCSGTTGSVTMEGATVDVDYCYPEAAGNFSAGVLLAANVVASDGWVIASGSPSGVVQINLSDAGTPASCSVSYTAASASAPMPSVATTTTGC